MTTTTKSLLLGTATLLLLNISSLVNAQDIWTAANQGDLETLKELVKTTDNVDVADPNFGMTPLISAILGNQPKALKMLIKNGANVNQVGLGGNTPLHAAAFLGTADIAKILLKEGADPLAANADGLLPQQTLQTDWPTTQNLAAMLQIQLNQAEVEMGRAEVDEEIEKTLNRRAKKDIYIAVLTQNVKAVRKLAKKSDLDAQRGPNDDSLLGLAATFNYPDVVTELVEAGANVNVKNADGATPLLIAAFFGRIEIVNTLLNAGADTSISNNDGTTPLVAAQADMAIVDYLASILGLSLDYNAVMAGKREAVNVLQAH